MSEYWNLKIVADSEEEVRTVLGEVADRIKAEPANVRIARYPKFPRMWECAFTNRSKAISDPIEQCAERFAALGTPSWENYWRDSSRPRKRNCYEAIADVRQHLFAVGRVFWAHAYCEARVARSSADPDDTQSDSGPQSASKNRGIGSASDQV